MTQPALLVFRASGLAALYLIIDHVYVDGVSVGILEEDLRAVWRGAGIAPGGQWPMLSDVVHAELARVSPLREAVALRRRPWVPRARKYEGSSTSAAVAIRLTRSDLRPLMELSGTSEFQLIFTMYGLALAMTFRSSSCIVGIPTIGLRMRDQRLVRAVGCYTNTIYVRLNFAGAIDFAEALNLGKRALVEAIDSDVPAIFAMDGEFAAVAARGEWLVRRLSYPLMEMMDDEISSREFGRVQFPYQTGGTSRRLMTLTVRRSSSDSLPMRVQTHSGDGDLARRAAVILADLMTELTTQGVTAGRAALGQVRSDPLTTTTGDHPRTRADKNQVVPWLRAVQASDEAFMVVRDQIGGDGNQSRTATDTLSVIRAYRLFDDTFGELPPELIRRDACLAGLRRSLAVWRELGCRRSLPL